MKQFAVPFSLSMLLALLAGCDIAADVRLTTDPINEVSDPLDPDEPDNVRAYFYTDRPVAGLPYTCSRGSGIPVRSQTNDDGRLVCPRASTATFYVGDTTESQQLMLGSVDMRMYGRAGEADSRNDVVINPGTLYGTVVDSNRREVTNIFNLLVTLDTVPGTFRLQERILLTEDLNTEVALGLGSRDLDLTLSPAAFATELEDLATAIHSNVELVNAGDALSDIAARALADRALRLARSGLYRHAVNLRAYDDATGEQFDSNLQFLVTRDGRISGLATRWIINTSTDPVSHDIELMTLAPGAVVAANGDISGFSFVSDTASELVLSGGLVNDAIFGTFEQLQFDEFGPIPENYVYSSLDEGKFDVDDGAFTGDMDLYRAAVALPDVDLDVLPPGFLPLDYALVRKGYPDGIYATDSDRANPAYPVPAGDAVLIRILPNGDIISDRDGDCTEVVDTGGELRDDAGLGQEEYVIGQVGRIVKFEGDEETTADDRYFLGIAVTIYEPDHPQFGFTLGVNPLGYGLQAAVIDTETGELRSQDCSPDETCDNVVEWFDDAFYFREVFGPALENGDSGESYFRRPEYYGRVTAGVEVCVGP